MTRWAWNHAVKVRIHYETVVQYTGASSILAHRVSILKTSPNDNLKAEAPVAVDVAHQGAELRQRTSSHAVARLSAMVLAVRSPHARVRAVTTSVV